MKATIKDVARLSGVSISTVSRVMNNPELVVPRKRQRVLEAIRELHYSPNALARGLIHKRTGTLGVLIPDISNLFYPAVLRGMEDAANQSDYNLIICNTDTSTVRRNSILKVLYEKQIDGVIWTSEPLSRNSYEMFDTLDFPVVLAATHSPDYEIPSVRVDDEQAAYDATVYLIKRRHTRIGMISGPPNDPISGYPRIQGFLRALRDHHLQFDESVCVEFGKYHFEDSYEAMKRLHGKYPEMTAVFASSDERALAAISYLHENQIRVPDEISVIGFDDTRMAGMSFPRLTTVAQPLYNIGYLAVDKLLKVINENPIEELRTCVPHQIIERNSVIDCTQRAVIK
ncbi:LacI family DNA-binding transcriptional regulator [Paenibacillus rhizophilus]|uniref:LacI family transcriptional regulator n=1 Tax=Paenibacillus rhizophilus TaxID=1850366 RepID=A0A3N9P1V6_9BACL|nr:LacI family DNA-binding transcriptional regulator [Paenibacillus rhizophilus]RQW09709.1 LacI family transcriptional regulator [Paenibacillus rhizophilus]